jgi:hypothetical protein
MNMRYLRLFACAAVLVWTAAEVAAAPRTFVSVNGNDTSPCSRALPCRSFSAAALVTDANGEIVALDSGGYGPVNVTVPVSIVAPKGVYAGITASSGNAITLNAGSGDVVLKNLYLNAQGADLGIHAITVGHLYVEGCVINGFNDGILFDPTTTNARLDVSDTVIRHAAVIGIYLTPGTARTTIDSVRFYRNQTAGLEIDAGEVTIRNSVASGPGLFGFRGELSGRMTIEDTVSTGNGYGFFVNGGAVIFATRCAATSNSISGMNAQFSSSTIYVSDSTIAMNVTGVSTSSTGAVLSRCTDVTLAPCPAGHFSNTLQSNTANGVFSGSYTSN